MEKNKDQVDATRKSYYEAVIAGALRTVRVFMGDSILLNSEKTLRRAEDVVICVPPVG